jgi:hypothetical protein
MSKAAQGFSPEAYVSTLRAETRGLRLVEPTPRRENAAHRKNSHLWMETRLDLTQPPQPSQVSPVYMVFLYKFLLPVFEPL